MILVLSMDTGLLPNYIDGEHLSVIPVQRLCRNRNNCYQHRHTGAGRYPELAENTGFRVALCLHGMTKK